jgi:hypothetical protein
VSVAGCVSCGSPPAGRFPDGSPLYRCGPHPPVYGLAPTGGPLVVVLTEEEVGRATARATLIVRTNQARGWRMMFTPVGKETPVDVGARGYGAELAAARATGLPLNWELLGDEYRRRDKAPDLGRRVEVRNARRASGLLAGHPGERRDWVYLLVVGTLPTFTVVGWLEGAELFVPTRWREPPAIPFAGYFAEQRELRPLPLPGDA